MHTYVHTHRSTPSWPATCEQLSSLPSLPQLKQIATLKALLTLGRWSLSGWSHSTYSTLVVSSSSKVPSVFPSVVSTVNTHPLTLMFDIQQILKSWGYQCIYITTKPMATKAGKRSMNLSRAIKSNDIGGMLTSMQEWISCSTLLLFIVLYLFRFMSTLHCAKLKFEEDVRNITAVMTKPLVCWYSITWGQWALTTSPPRWVSAPPLYDSVSAQQWSQQCSQNLCLPFMSSQPLHYLHYIIYLAQMFSLTSSVVHDF